jgi:hypothetical protein
MMNINKVVQALFFYLFIMVPNAAWAAVRTEPSYGVWYLFLVVAVLGGLLTFLGFIIVLRGVNAPAEVSVNIPNLGEFKFSKVGQGIVLAIIGAIILISSLYFYPTTTIQTTTETTITEDEDGTRTIHREMAR